MYTKLFENQAKKLGIKEVKQTNLFVELFMDNKLLEKIDTEKLFMTSLEISTKFKFNYLNNRLSIKLMLKDLDKHFIYYLVDLLLKIDSM